MEGNILKKKGKQKHTAGTQCDCNYPHKLFFSSFFAYVDIFLSVVLIPV